ncbi:MAG: HlyD family secretion protein [Rickettsiaceae bacterium]
MNNRLSKLFSYKHFKLILFLTIIALIFLSHFVRIWINTQSTDDAYVEAHISRVGIEIDGIIDEVLINDDEHADKGDIVAIIKDHNYLAILLKAKAELNAAAQRIDELEKNILIAELNLQKAQNALGVAEITFKLTDTDYRRTVTLHKDDYASARLYDNAQIKYESVKLEYIEAELALEIAKHTIEMLLAKKEAAIQSLEALNQSLAIAQNNFDKTRIRAPVSGVIGSSSLRVGNFVNPGIILFSIIPDNSMYIKANFKETQIAQIKSGMITELRFDAIPGKKFKGVVRNLYPATGSKFSLIPTDNATGNFTKIVQRLPVLIDFEIDTKKYSLTPGMSTIVDIRTNQKRKKPKEMKESK